MTILILSDERQLSLYLMFRLRLDDLDKPGGHGIGVIELADHWMMALERMKKKDIDVIFCDLNIEGSLQFLAAIKGDSLWHSIPVVMITHEGCEAKEAGAVSRGAAGFIRNPFTADSIKEILPELFKPEG